MPARTPILVREVELSEPGMALAGHLCRRAVETDMLSTWSSFREPLLSEWKGKNGRKEKNISSLWVFFFFFNFCFMSCVVLRV